MQITAEIDLASDLDALVVWVSRNAGAPMSYTALRTLGRIDQEGPRRTTELAESERVSQPAMTSLLQRLEADGHVCRTPDPDDGRASRIALTETGRAVLAERRADRARLISDLLQDLTPEQRDGLGAALAALRPALATPIARKVEPR